MSTTLHLQGTLVDDPNTTPPVGTPDTWFIERAGGSGNITSPGMCPMPQAVPPRWVRPVFPSGGSHTGLAVKLRTIGI